MGLSRRQYAAHRGVSHTAVAKAIASGRITLEADGSIDPVKADRQWDAQTDPAKQRGVHAPALGSATAAGTARAAAATRPVPRAAIESVGETLREAGADPEAGASGEVSFLRARMANEVIKAQTAKVRLQKMKVELVDRARTTAMVFDLARRERDAWQNWPPRVAANMAAELGVDPHQMEQVLDKYLRKHLGDLAEVKVDLR
ncbi:elements of external origin [Paracoccus jeotgali]|uniref:Elements of external origin n=1 Tax=Paracoccus jeotgali TaxID=2065379 RepID=A0A2K9MBD8_9RHOB|nr:elements of external origin [Paracoccus jeotgali]AUM72967.1 elements of external origin [Paracoccus jeotgali]